MPRCSSTPTRQSVQKPPYLVSLCEPAPPICLKHSVYRCSMLELSCMSCPFQRNPLSALKNPHNMVSFLPYLSIPCLPHLLHTSSRVTYCPYVVQKNTQVLSPLGPLPPSRTLFRPHLLCTWNTNAPVLQDLLYCRFLPEAFLSTLLLSY